MLAGVLLLANAAGFLTEESLARRGGSPAHQPSPLQFVLVYAGLLLFGAGGATVLESWLGIPDDRGIPGLGGAMFLLASTGRPWWLFGTVRRLGWFGLIESDSAIRLLLGGIGLLLAIGSIVA